MEYTRPKTEKEFILLFEKIAREEFKWECNVPVIINPRIRKDGLYFSMTGRDNIPRVVRFEFSTRLLKEETHLKDIINTMRHELVHWYTDLQEKKRCSHNEAFINNCLKFNVTDETNFERYRSLKKLQSGQYYEAKCRGCDRVVAKSKNLRNLKRFMDRQRGTVCCCGAGYRYIDDRGVIFEYNHGDKRFGKEYWLDSKEVLDRLKITLCKE